MVTQWNWLSQTYTGPILVAVNPYMELPYYGQDSVMSYHGAKVPEKHLLLLLHSPSSSCCYPHPPPAIFTLLLLPAAPAGHTRTSRVRHRWGGLLRPQGVQSQPVTGHLRSEPPPLSLITKTKMHSLTIACPLRRVWGRQDWDDQVYPGVSLQVMTGWSMELSIHKTLVPHWADLCCNNFNITTVSTITITTTTIPSTTITDIATGIISTPTTTAAAARDAPAIYIRCSRIFDKYTLVSLN